MKPKSATIRVRVTDGTWETIGTDRAPLTFENLELDWDQWGPSAATFDLKRSVLANWPDIAAFNDVEIEVGGVQVWKGRVKGTPSRDDPDRVMSVQCEGLQYHLDDDVYRRAYVVSSLSDYKDHRSLLSANLAYIKQSANISTDSGITIGWPKGAQLDAGDNLAGVQLDLGLDPAGWAKKITVEYESSGNAAAITFRAGNSLHEDIYRDVSGANENAITFALDGSHLSGTQPGTWTTARRYVNLYLYYAAGAATTSADHWIKIKAVRIYTDTAYESGNASVLKSSDVVLDALAKGTVLLDSDRSKIATTSLNIPEFNVKDYATPREVISAVNAYHSYATKVDERGVPVFQPLDSAATIEVGQWAAINGEDASQNSGDEVYSRVIVTGTGPDGSTLEVARSSVELTNAEKTRLSDAITNSSFDTNTTGWSVNGSASILRTTTAGNYASGPGGGQFGLTPGSGATWYVLSGTFRKGSTYILTIKLKGALTDTGYPMYVAFGDTASATNSTVKAGTHVAGSFTENTLVWTPTADVTTARVQIYSGTVAGYTGYFDDVYVHQATPTVVDRRGFTRTKILQVNNALDSGGAIGTAIADAYLTAHKHEQFKGSYSVTGPVRDILTGGPVPAEQLGMYTTRMIRFSDRPDPNTGSWGRDGRIASVHYSHSSDQASVSIDNTSQNFESFLARLALFSPAS